MPSNALPITGPSKSADIEQTRTYGVHGPKGLIVLIRTTSAWTCVCRKGERVAILQPGSPQILL